VTIHTAKAVIEGILREESPEIFDMALKRDNSLKFKLTDSWVRKRLRMDLGWSWRSATNAAQKLPEDWEEKAMDMIYRARNIQMDNDIPPELNANFDQLQIRYVSGSDDSWAKRGDKQVSVVGTEDKRSITTMTGCTQAGDALPLQVIYQGYSERSLPSEGVPGYDEAMQLGFRFVYSKTKTYWSTQATMRDYIDNILVPYFQKKKEELGLPPEQKSMFTMDCWSVHKSSEFRTWLRENHPNIKYHYVPACLTGKMQPCDLALQRILKLAVKRASHEDMAAETIDHLRAGGKPSQLVLSTSIPVLRNRTPRWLVEGYKAINKPEMVKKASTHTEHVIF
jgi:hypothetical protein